MNNLHDNLPKTIPTKFVLISDRMYKKNYSILSHNIHPKYFMHGKCHKNHT